MEIIANKDLTALNTFRMRVSAECFAEYDSVSELIALLSDPGLPRPFIPLGGGSNILFTGDVKGTVLHGRIKGMEFFPGGARVGAGEVFDVFCAEAAARGLWGVENLSGIPGEAGASAVQNIGAYGVEVKDVISAIEVLDTETLSELVLRPADCGYRYRGSNFKDVWKGRYIVTAVRYNLSPSPLPRLHYGNVASAVAAACPDGDLTPEKVRGAILGIRKGKLPDPEETGSAGSFFKNPFVDRETWLRISAAEGEVPHFDNPDGTVKIPAAWLIDRCGLKGLVLGNAAVYERQPLVLVNLTGRAEPSEILAIEELVIKKVKDRFGIVLSPEVEHI